MSVRPKSRRVTCTDQGQWGETKLYRDTRHGMMFAIISLLPAAQPFQSATAFAQDGRGSVVGWEWNQYGQCNAPEPNWDFVAVAAGTSHGLGLKVDGSVVAWGYNISGQCNVPGPNSWRSPRGPGTVSASKPTVLSRRGEATGSANAVYRSRIPTLWQSRPAGSTVSV